MVATKYLQEKRKGCVAFLSDLPLSSSWAEKLLHRQQGLALRDSTARRTAGNTALLGIPLTHEGNPVDQLWEPTLDSLCPGKAQLAQKTSKEGLAFLTWNSKAAFCVRRRHTWSRDYWWTEEGREWPLTSDSRQHPEWIRVFSSCFQLATIENSGRTPKHFCFRPRVCFFFFFFKPLWIQSASPVAQSMPAMQLTWVRCMGWHDPLEEITPPWVFLPGESHGHRGLVGYSPLVQFNSVAQSCVTLCDPMDRSTPGLSVHHRLPEFTQTHVHWVGDAIQPSQPLSSHPVLLLPSIFPRIGVFSNESVLCIRWPKY